MSLPRGFIRREEQSPLRPYLFPEVPERSHLAWIIAHERGEKWRSIAISCLLQLVTQPYCHLFRGMTSNSHRPTAFPSAALPPQSSKETKRANSSTQDSA